MILLTSALSDSAVVLKILNITTAGDKQEEWKWMH